MKDEKEIQIALRIWILINQLNDLLWDHYGEEFLDIYLKEEEDKYLRSLEPINPIDTNGRKNI